jgi:hypothetical protein
MCASERGRPDTHVVDVEYRRHSVSEGCRSRVADVHMHPANYGSPVSTRRKAVAEQTHREQGYDHQEARNGPILGPA